MKKEKKAKQERCLCPYCEVELTIAHLPFCRDCGVVFRRCAKCHITVLDKKAKDCPKCGEPLI